MKLNYAPNTEKQQALLSEIHSFVRKAQGLRGTALPDGKTRISQAIDDKFLEFATSDLEGVLSRSDTEGQEFLQVNFCSGKKVLITSTLIGFKPIALKGIDLAKLPRVVTTPDIFSVFEAVQDALHATDTDPREINVLKKVFEAVIAGGESVGFDLSKERALMARIPTTFTKLAA
jgi:hypothetical protein